MRVRKAFGHMERTLKLHSSGGAVITSPALTSISTSVVAIRDPKSWAEQQYNDVYRRNEEGLLSQAQRQDGHQRAFNWEEFPLNEEGRPFWPPVDAKVERALRKAESVRTGLLELKNDPRVMRVPQTGFVPSSQVGYVLKLAHESAAESAHAGASRLFLRLKDRFFWPAMWKDILEFCQLCDVCQKINPDRRPPAGLLRPHKIPLLPWDVVSLDLITGLPNSHGFTAILVIVDKLTKYVLYIPTTNELKQEGFADLFLEHVVRRFGLPLEMIADRDPRWAKSFWQSVASSLGLKLMLSTSHHPQHDGQTERANQTLEIALRAFVAGERKHWSKWLSLLAHAYNSTPQSSTGYAPHFLLFGYTPRSELSLLDPMGRGIHRDKVNNASAISFLQELDVHRA